MIYSISFFVKSILKRREYDIVFSTSVAYNVGKHGENLFFKPMIEICDKKKIRYVILEERDLKGRHNNFKNNKESIPLDFIFLIQIILRKIYNFKYGKPDTLDENYKRELTVSGVLKKIFFRKFYSKIFITMNRNNATLWRVTNPKSDIVDFQHGIIYHGHKDRLTNGFPPKFIAGNNVISFVFGNRFKKILIENDKSGFYNENNVIVTGVYKNKMKHIMQSTLKNQNKLLFTLQITPDYDKEVYRLYRDAIVKLIDYNSDFLTKKNYEVIFKHHPRFNSIDCEDLNMKYDFISFSDDRLPSLMKKVDFHITFNSTSTFEAAAMEVPTIFIDMYEIFSPKEIFLKQYEYPCKDLLINNFSDLKNILLIMEDDQLYARCRNKIIKWNHEFYNDFNEAIFMKFIKKRIEI